MFLIFFCGRKSSKIEVRNNVQVILLKFKMVTRFDLLNICDRKNSNLINGGGAIGLRASCSNMVSCVILFLIWCPAF